MLDRVEQPACARPVREVHAIQVDQAACTSGSSNSGSCAKPSPFSTAQRLAIW